MYIYIYVYVKGSRLFVRLQLVLCAEKADKGGSVKLSCLGCELVCHISCSPPSLCSRVTIGSSFPHLSPRLFPTNSCLTSLFRDNLIPRFFTLQTAIREVNTVWRARGLKLPFLQQSLRLGPSCGVSMMNLIMADEALNII